MDIETRFIARNLISELGCTIVGAMSGEDSLDTIRGWTKPDGPLPAPQDEIRLRTAYEIWHDLCRSQVDDAVRNWFVQPNPELGGRIPVVMIHDGEFDKVRVAAEQFKAGGV